MKLLTFLKSKVFIIICAVILLLLLFGMKQCQVKRLTERITTIEQSNLSLNSDRLYLQSQVIKHQIDYKVISARNDSLKKVLEKYQLALVNLKEKHKAELAELVKIPNDTVYVRLQTLYPNYDSEILKYPFSGFQIGQIYSTAISFDMIQQEYSLQGKSLQSCFDLNDGFEKGIVNLNSQITGLQDNILKADSQIKNYDKEIVILNKQINKKTFWNRTLLGGVAVAVAVILIK